MKPNRGNDRRKDDQNEKVAIQFRAFFNIGENLLAQRLFGLRLSITFAGVLNFYARRSRFNGKE